MNEGAKTIISDVRLNVVSEKHLDWLRTWRNDATIRARTREWKLLNNIDQKKWYAQIHDRPKWPEHLMFSIEIKESFSNIIGNSKEAASLSNVLDLNSEAWFMCGICGLTNIDWINRSAELSFYIGSEKYQRRSIGSRALERLKDEAFTIMNLDLIWAEVYEYAITIAEFLKKNDFFSAGAYLPSRVTRFNKSYGSYFYYYYKSQWGEEKNNVIEGAEIQHSKEDSEETTS